MLQANGEGFHPLKFRQFLKESLIDRDTLLDEADGSGLVDDEGDPSRCIELLQFPPFIRDQWESQTMLAAKLFMSRQTVGADAQDLGVELFKT